MKVLILGLGKSGTTAMVYKVAGGLPDCRAFSGGKPGKYVGDYENAVYKHTYEPRKGKDFDLYREHLKKEHYDRKIWMARDPRDAAVSKMLYRWHKGYAGRRKQYQAHLDRVLQKEKDPRSISFGEICRYIGHGTWPLAIEAVVEEERQRYREMAAFVETLGDDWFLFRFEDMVAKNFDALNQYLGFQFADDVEVPKGTGKDKVVRKKASGDWRHWFTQEDVAWFKPAYVPYMDVMGYDTEDWEPAASPLIEPEFSSVYMQNLPKKATQNVVLRYIDPILQRFNLRS
jgi:hypothetical protein